jgi:hypothetical protein
MGIIQIGDAPIQGTMIRVNAPVVASASELLTKHFTTDEIGSESSFGSHRVKSYMGCNRLAYYTYIKRLQTAQKSMALDIGTLIHACLARNYMTGGKDTWKPLEALINDMPDTVLEVQRILTAYFRKWGSEEANTWSVRAVEHEAKGLLSMNGLTCPLTARYDLVIAKRPWGSPDLPPGPNPNGCYVVEHKSTRALTNEYTRGYSFDFQIMTQATLWKLGGMDEILGPLNGFIINILVKTKEPQFHRLEVVITDDDIARFLESITPPAVELYAKMNDPARRDNPKHWPLNMSYCKAGGYGLCKYFDLCESGGSAIGLYEERK